MQSKTLLVAAISGSALADFFIGNCAYSDLGDYNVTGIALPGGKVDCGYTVVKENEDICVKYLNGPRIDTTNRGGICPNQQHERPLDFCVETLPGSGCPPTYKMSVDGRDDCGAIALYNRQLPANGWFYADLIDTNRSNIAIGRCTYEQANGGGKTHCPQNGKAEEWCATFIRCYTHMYGEFRC